MVDEKGSNPEEKDQKPKEPKVKPEPKPEQKPDAKKPEVPVKPELKEKKVRYFITIHISSGMIMMKLYIKVIILLPTFSGL